MEKYYSAGYYLIKKLPNQFGLGKEKTITTCSDCFNTHAFGTWAFNPSNPQPDKEKRVALGLNDEIIQKIQKWAYNKLINGELEYGDFFTDLKAALEFKGLFFKERVDIELFGIELSESETKNLIEDFLPGRNEEYNFNDGHFALRESVLKMKDPVPLKASDFIGFDLIGVEGDGSFHTFYCHGLAKELNYRFGLNVNEYGLFSAIPDKELVKDFLNDPSSGLEPVPWYIVKVKKIKY